MAADEVTYNTRAEMPPALQARVALMRFGLGPRRNAQPAFWTTRNAGYDQCIKELDAPGAATVNPIDLDPAGANYKLLLTEEQAATLAPGGQPSSGVNYRQEQRARYAKHLIPRVGFTERLALFWMNHFNIYNFASNTVYSLIGAAERNIIRANTLGLFENMLLAVSQNGAMLTYLDGRNSTAANTNQNFAREILELHTLGSNAATPLQRAAGENYPNYDQTDVETLAKILTGWGVQHDQNDAPYLVPKEKLSAHPWNYRNFTFKPYLHATAPTGSYSLNTTGYDFAKRAPAARTDYRDNGVDTGIAVLKALAQSPQTARHIAASLLCHFVSDTPSDEAVNTLAATFTSSGGNLKEVARAMLNLDEAWTTPLSRLRQPYPWFISVMRGIGLPARALSNVYGGTATYQDKIDYIGGYLRILNQQPWTWPTPDGYPDRDSYWMNGNALRLRASLVYDFLSFLKSSGFPRGNGMVRVAQSPDGRTGVPIVFGSKDVVVPATETILWTEPSAIKLVENVMGGMAGDPVAAQVKTLAGTDNTAALALLFSSPAYLFM